MLIGYTAEDGLGPAELEQIGFDETTIRGEGQLLSLLQREFGEANGQAALAHYTYAQPPTGRKRIREALGGFSRDVWYSAATWHMADALALSPAPAPVYVYRFSHKVHQCATPCLPKCAWHGCDTCFWNAEEPIRPHACKAHNHPSPAATPLGQTMHEYLVRFARHGDPNGAGLPAWDPHAPGRLSGASTRPGRLMELGGQQIGMVELEASDAERHAFCRREWFGKRLRKELERE